MARRRLTAFDVSFPEERDRDEDGATMTNTSVGSVHASSLGKRKGDVIGDVRVPKRLQLPKPSRYRRQPGEIDEDDKLIIDGEDPYQELDGGNSNDIYVDSDDESGVAGPSNTNSNDKPIRELYEFIIFDPKHGNELVSLDALEQDDGVDRWFEAVGRVRAHFVSDEDDGQEDGFDEELLDMDDDGRWGGGTGTGKRVARRIHLSSIMRATVDYTNENEPFYIETMYAWYILMKPAKDYKEFYQHFYTPRRVAQLVISWALKRPHDSFSTFHRRFTSKVDIFGHTYVEQDLFNSLLEIQQAVLDEAESRKINSVPFVRQLLSFAPPPTAHPARKLRDGSRNKRLPKSRATVGSIDLAVLKAENQIATHVTPRIARLARGLFREDIEVVGPPPPPVDKAQVESERNRRFEELKSLYAQAKKVKKKIDYRKEDRISVLDDKYKAVRIDGVVYNIGDVILTPRNAIFKENGPIPHLGDRVDQFFWFGRIHYIRMDHESAHVEWFYHGSQTIMDELGHPQELFLSNQCGSVAFQLIGGKVKLAYFAEPEKLKHDEYFCKFMYDPMLASYEHIDQRRLKMFSEQQPPHNCLSCALLEERSIQVSQLQLKNEHGVAHGLAFGGKQFHLEDFVLYRANSGPCNIGYVVGIKFENHSTFVTVRKVGRISSLEKRIIPAKMIKDERHLYLTDEKDKVSADKLLDVIYAPSVQSFQAPHATLEEWLNLSYRHFYVRYAFPKLDVKSWKDRRKLTWQEFYVCTPCYKERLKGRKLMQKFLHFMKPRPLSTLDLFAGVGAFSRGLVEGSGCLNVTHAIEISPSAAQTFRRNSQDTVVYNQCANLMLRYAIKSFEGHNIEAPKQIFDDKEVVPPPPKPGDIKAIVAGFPCQSHSTLNMFKKQDDLKTNLILTTLSYLDFYKPTYAFFENVPGFLNFHLQADRANLHGAKGEIEKGGLKLLIRALVDMNYQVRFGLLQATHYGLPQRRVRFFLVAAKEGHQLPEFPQPTHDYPDAKEHVIRYSDGETQFVVNPARGTKGIAMHPVVTILDAIGDLPQFDWEHPNPRFESSAKREERRQRAETIPSLKCKKTEPHCGFSGVIGYNYEPKTTYQYHARLEPTVDMQHYTKCILPQKVVQVLNIPLRAGADYRDLPTNQLSWGIADPMSSAAQKNYRRGIYGRLDANNVFPTTVTNVDPTAKQSQVLHPYCHRMVTVRELARSQGFPDSFVFESIGNNVITMHRQIGNAVPIPLAHALGRQLRGSLFHKWRIQDEDVIVIADEDGEPAVASRHPQVASHNDHNDEDDDMDIYE